MKTKSVAKRGRPATAVDLAEHFERTIKAAQDQDLSGDRTEHYRRMLRSGTTGTFRVIDAALTDRRADNALRLHIAEMIDRGEELTTQLRAYAVRYLVNPLDILRGREG